MSSIYLQDRSGIGGVFTIEKYDARTGELLEVHGPETNRIVASASSNTGRHRILEVITGVDTTHQLKIDEAQLGDDDTAPSDSDTALGNALKTGISVADNSMPAKDQGRIEFFIADANLSNDTYKEIGLFANGTMMTRSVFSNDYVKSSGEDTKVVYDLTLSAS